MTLFKQVKSSLEGLLHFRLEKGGVDIDFKF